MQSVITAQNKKLLSKNINTVPPCNCRLKNKCPVNGKCRTRNILYKYVASTSMKLDKVYLGITEGDFNQRFYNHKKSFNNSTYHHNDTTLCKYVWDIKEKYSKTPVLKWYIVRTVPSYSNIPKRCLLCLHEKSEVSYCPSTEELLNKRSGLIAKCRHANKYLLCNCKSNNWKRLKESSAATQRHF